jgi:hypothetical protein
MKPCAPVEAVVEPVENLADGGGPVDGGLALAARDAAELRRDLDCHRH